VAFAPDGGSLAVGYSDTTILLWDLNSIGQDGAGRGRATTTELERFYSDLASEDSHTAFRAIANLAAHPGQAIAVLARALRAEAANQREIPALLRALDSDDFRVRERATARLTDLSWRTESALRCALNTSPSPEVRARAAELLQKVPRSSPPLEHVWAARVVEVLELTNTPEGHDLLSELAHGSPEVRLTTEARTALSRLCK
jgi:HEAT repeat protein